MWMYHGESVNKFDQYIVISDYIKLDHICDIRVWCTPSKSNNICYMHVEQL